MGSPTSEYAYIWEYSVNPEYLREFEEAYGPNGPWVKLFAPAEGYLRTELHRDLKNPHRYLTIDYWKSVDDWEAFRLAMSKQFEEIDAQCEAFTLTEREIGRLLPLS